MKFDIDAIDYSKLPWYWRRFEKLQKFWCFIGLHVPMRLDANNEPGRNDEYLCQECFARLSENDWKKFFEKAKGGNHNL